MSSHSVIADGKIDTVLFFVRMVDIWRCIIGQINRGSDYKAIYLVDHSRKGIAAEVHPDADIKFANHLLTFWKVTQAAEIIPKQFDNLYEFTGFVFHNLSRTVSAQYILAYPDKPWTWFNGIANNPNITVDVIGVANGRCDWFDLSCNPGISIEDILANPKIYWNWNGVSMNPNVTMAHVLANPDKPWNWSGLTCNPGINTSDITANPDKPWVWRFISENPNIDGKFILANPDKPWDFCRLSKNPGITTDFITTHPDWCWEWGCMSENPNITDGLVLANPDKPWNWAGLSCNPSITAELTYSHPQLTARRPNIITGELSWVRVRQLLMDPGITWKKMVELLFFRGTEK